MTALRGTTVLARAYLKRSFRSRTSLFWNFAFPLLWLFVFGYVFAGGTTEGVEFLMPGLFVITILAISFAGISYRVVNERERGTLRRYRATPVGATAIVLATATSSLVLLAVSLALLGATARIVFGAGVAGSALDAAAVLLVGSLAFVPVGLVVGSAAPTTDSAPAINNALFFPLIFVTGAAIPFAMLPGWVQTVGRALPPTYLVEALQAVAVRGEPLTAVAGSLAVLLATAAVGVASAAALFRWESGEPVGRGRAAAVVAGLALLLLGTWLLGPELGIAEQAHPRQLQLPGAGP